MRSFKSMFYVSFYSLVMSMVLISLIITISRSYSIDSMTLGGYLGSMSLIGGIGIGIFNYIIKRDIHLPDINNVAFNINITCRKNKMNRFLSDIKDSFETFKSSIDVALILFGIFIIIGSYMIK